MHTKYPISTNKTEEVDVSLKQMYDKSGRKLPLEGLIYRIDPINPTNVDDVYIGSTIYSLKERMNQHCSGYKSYKNGICIDYMTSFILFEKYGVENCKITLIALLNVKTEQQLRRKEAFHINTIPCVNIGMKTKNGVIKNDVVIEEGCVGCVDCQYFSTVKSNLRKHFISKKHILATRTDVMNENEPSKFKCLSCSKPFESRQGLWRHKSKCKNIKPEIIVDPMIQINIVDLSSKIDGLENKINALLKIFSNKSF